MFKNMTKAGKGIVFVLVVAGIYGATVGYTKLFPKKAKSVVVTEKANGLPPLAYDKGSSAPARPDPDFKNAVTINSPLIKAEIMGWNAQLGALYAAGGASTSKGSICEEQGVNAQFAIQNSTNIQAQDLYAFAAGYKSGDLSKGAAVIAWMGDGAPKYLSGLNARIRKDIGDEYIGEVVDFWGSSFGEDKWIVRSKYAKNAIGSLNVGVIMDGD